MARPRDEGFGKFLSLQPDDKITTAPGAMVRVNLGGVEKDAAVRAN